MDGVTTFDYTQLNNSTASFASFWTWTETQEIKKPCENLESASWWLSTGDFSEVKCINVDDNIAKVIWKWQSLKRWIKLVDGNYKLDLEKVIEWNSGDKWNGTGEWKTKEETKQSLNMMKSMWFEMNYVLKLPTKILDANIWRINNDKLTFNVYEVINTDNPYVIFKNDWDIQTNWIKNAELTLEPILESKHILYKKLILFKRELKKTYKWRKDIAKFDSLIPKVDDKKLLDLNNRIWSIDKSNRLYRKYENFLNYLDAKIWLEIYKRWLNK
jgi:hypothetical protein